MSQPLRSTTAGAPARAAAAAPRGAQRRHPADDIALAVRDLQDLEDDMRRQARSATAVDALEERAHAICQAILTPFRGPAARPAAAPLYVARDGRSALW